ncbi:MAG: hypothetical protein EHM14_05195 [Methanothrix sp.]|nr:MAG: hypothetical protein EHM14_05195 [Methanothrix sp.]
MYKDLILSSETTPANEKALGLWPAFEGWLNKIHEPTIVIIRDRNVLPPPRDSFLMPERIPGAQIGRIEGAGHIFGSAILQSLCRL